MTGKYDPDPFSDETKISAGEARHEESQVPKKTDENPRSSEQLIDLLHKEELIQDVFGTAEDKYTVETSVRKNNREWAYSCSVLYNDAEIKDDISLIRDDYKRDAQQTGNIDTEWNLLLKKAVEIHLYKCDKLIRRIKEKERKDAERKKLSVIKTVLTAFLFLALAGGSYLWFFILKSDKPKVSGPDKKQAESLPAKQTAPVPVKKPAESVPAPVKKAADVMPAPVKTAVPPPAEKAVPGNKAMPVPVTERAEPAPVKESLPGEVTKEELLERLRNNSGKSPKPDSNTPKISEDLKKEILERLK